MAERSSHLRLVDGGRAQPAERIALSLVVHERRCLNIPLHAIIGIDAFATQTFSGECGPVTYDLPHVDIRITPPMQQKLWDFTRDIVGEVMEVHVRGRCIARPVLREPLGTDPGVHIDVCDFAAAQALADLLRVGWRPVRAVE